MSLGIEKKLDLCVEPAAFFQEKVAEVMSRQNFATIELAEYYLVDLLARFMLASNLFDKITQNDEKDRDPLAFMFLKAQEAGVSVNERVKILKKLGDTSLYISGFFADSLNRKVIDLDYYREMGSIAYRSLSETIRDGQFQVLYNELHAKFSRFVDVLTELSQEAFIQNNPSVIRLYELYARTGSELAKRQLEEKGLPIVGFIPNNPKKSQKN